MMGDTECYKLPHSVAIMGKANFDLKQSQEILGA